MDETLEPFGCLDVFTTAGYGWPASYCKGGGSDAGDRGRQGTQLIKSTSMNEDAKRKQWCRLRPVVVYSLLYGALQARGPNCCGH